jgi:macrolide-specific efflux system membrane fusion protein
VIKAPFSGTVTAVSGTVGGSSSGSGGGSSGASSGTGSSGGGSASSGSSATSSSGTSSTSSGSGGFIELADLSKLQIQGNFTESDTTKIKAGQAATASFDALTGVTAPGRVTAIGVSPTTSNNVVQYSVTVALGTKPSGVRLGQTATVEVTVARASDVLYVPTAAVRTAGGQSTVTVQQNGSQVVKTVETGVRGDQGTEITSGLNEGDRVVIIVAGSGANGFSGPGIGGGAGRVGRGGAGLGGGGRP